MALYDAFISYSHAKDKPVAATLQAAIQKLGKPWYQRRALRLFRDDTSLSATPHLWPTIEQALGQSRFFLLLASPEAAASKWVNKEVGYWIENNSIETLLIGLTDGELDWQEGAGDFLTRDDFPLPPVLAKRFPSEPKWVDLRPYRTGVQNAASRRDAKFTELAADFAAAIRGMPKEDLLSQEVRQQRNALRLAIGAAAALLILAAGATAASVLAYRAEQDAYRQQQEAIAQRNRAEATLAAATRTANSLVFDLAQRFRNNAGIPATLIKDILGRARDLQEQLINSGQVTPDLKRSEAVTLIELSDSLVAIGATKDAFAAADQAEKIFDDLTARYPGNKDYQRGLFVSYVKRGGVQVAQGDFNGALITDWEALVVADPMLRSDPGNAGWQDDVAEVDNSIGRILKSRGELAGALKSYRDGLAIRQRLAQADPANPVWQRGLWASESSIGDLQMQNDVVGAQKSYESALAIMEQLTQSAPANTDLQRQLSVSYQNVGGAQETQGNLAAALKFYQASLHIMERLARPDPGNTGWHQDLASAYERVGDVQMAQRDFAGALKSYQADLDIMVQLSQTDAGNAAWQQALAASYSRIGNALRAQGDVADAVETYRNSLAIMDRLASSDSGNAEWQRDVMVAAVKLAEIDPAESRTLLTRALEIAKSLQAKGLLAPRDGWMPDELAKRLAALGQASKASP